MFTGAANYWHGVDYLVVLQGELNKIDSGIQIVCGGGKVSVADDPDTVLMNITPLDDKDCADLVQASDACILPVRQSRVSPGSPLKLYDYILHKKYVITQENLNGYSDEVKKYGHGTHVDFNENRAAALKIKRKLNCLKNDSDQVDIDSFSWDSRMVEWVRCI